MRKVIILFRRVKNIFYDLLFPVSCRWCGMHGNFLCGNCTRTLLTFIPPTCVVCRCFVPHIKKSLAGRTCASCRKKSAVSVFLSPFSYEGHAVRELIHDLKYNRVRAIGPFLGALAINYLRYFEIVFPDNAIFIPLPLSKSRERVRGFNQSQIIAEYLGSALEMPVVIHALKKIRTTAPQMELARSSRLENMIGAFQVNDESAVRGTTCVLVDDVKTTGATLNEAAKVLKQAGAKNVWAFTIAH